MNEREVVSDRAKSHAKFLNALQESQKSVRMVGSWLESRGHHVVVQEPSFAPTWDDWREHIDSHDILLIEPNGQQRTLEVKRRGVWFTSRADFPYPDMTVDEKRKFDQKSPQPYAYFMLNKPMTHIAIVMCNTRPQWSVRSLRHQWLDRSDEYYVCPLTLAAFAPLVMPAPVPAPHATIYAANEFGF